MRVYVRYMGAFIVLVAIAAAFVLFSGSDSGDIKVQPLDPIDTTAEETPDPGIDLATLAKLPSDPVPPAELDPAEEDTESDDAYEKYLRETAVAVRTHASEITALGDSVLLAYVQGDAGAFAAHFPADEDITTEIAQELLDRYPSIISGELASNVNVFAVGDATLYVYYLNVTWIDGEITSSHTIEIPMRFVDAGWYVSSVALESGDSRFIQSVMLSEE